MSTIHSKVNELEMRRSSQVEPNTISCFLDAEVSRWSLRESCSDRLLTAEALCLLIGLDRELKEARADWNQDRFRRLMKARYKAVSRIRRRWSKVNPEPGIGLGKLRRRYHANLAGYLYQNDAPR